jgi:hypothetical protein
LSAKPARIGEHLHSDSILVWVLALMAMKLAPQPHCP